MVSADPLTETTRVRRSPRVAARIFNGQAIVVVTDAQRLFSLNGVGTRIWELADGRSLAQIADAIAGEFDVDAGQALNDITSFVSALSDAGAVNIEPSVGHP